MRSLLAILLSVPLICPGQEAESLHIQPGDVLRISVRGEPDISCSVSVRANGFITMPLVNEIKVAGLTVQQVQTFVVERLQHFVANPEVTVSIEGKVHTHPNFTTAVALPAGCPSANRC
jgi:protein involved in polysaccharide export with SLBB domain